MNVFWACLHCRSQVVIPQDQSNIEDELSQKIEDMKNNLKSEIESFKTEVRDCFRTATTSEPEKQLSSKASCDNNKTHSKD